MKLIGFSASDIVPNLEVNKRTVFSCIDSEENGLCDKLVEADGDTLFAVPHILLS